MVGLLFSRRRASYFFSAKPKKRTKKSEPRPCRLRGAPGRGCAALAVEGISLLTPTASLLTPTASLLTPTASLLTPHSYDLTPHSYGLTPHSYGLTPHSYDLTPHSYGLTPHSYGLTPHSYGLTPHSYDLTPHSYGLTPHPSKAFTQKPIHPVQQALHLCNGGGGADQHHVVKGRNQHLAV